MRKITSNKLKFDVLTNNFSGEKKEFATGDQAFNLKNNDK